MNQIDAKRAAERYRLLADNARKRFAEKKRQNIPCIHIGMATCGLAAGAVATRAAFEEALAETGIEADVVPVGCLGHCYAEPLVVIENPGFPPICYHKVSPSRARALVKTFLGEGDPIFEYVLGAMEENDLIPKVMDFPRFNLERRVIMEKCGLINPEEIDAYLVGGGYSGLPRALAMPPEDIIAEVLKSGLRGRGGAGFPTGLKWQYARAARGTEKFMICNADEGDPGAYMDRTILESNPHLLLEGMTIAARAVGAEEGIIYVRAEYPLAVERLESAIRQAKESGLLGTDILSSGLDFEVSIFQGSGAFVCGEETALIQSLEGNRGTAQSRPPYPVQSGLWHRPTVINNVKTLASITPIIMHGGKWYSDMGSPRSRGTGLFSVVGKVVHPGLVEIAMGTTLRTLIYDICGGIPKHKKFKAVQIGGPSGGCLPERFLDTPIDFDSLTEAGAMMGSGGMVVMDEDDCMVDVARYFVDFTQKESCGKCTFCRIGTRHLLNVLERLTIGEGRDQDLELLKTLSEDIKDGSLCGLGKTAPNPVLTTLRYFPGEYEAHLLEKRCPANRCRVLTAYYIDLEKCARGCDVCVGCCPVEAIFTTPNRKKAIDQSRCVKCTECMAACPAEYAAVKRVSPPELAPIIERPKEK